MKANAPTLTSMNRSSRPGFLSIELLIASWM
jgi:hypothetical protein